MTVSTVRSASRAAGNAKLVNKLSPDGKLAFGMNNNCANGYTPWGTYLTCEENWAGYFASRDADLPRELKRYGLRSTSRFGWDTLPGDEFQRFDATRKAADASGDYRNEPNHFGWIVEIDPFDPDSTPVKHSALGRFAHEGLIFAPVQAGRRRDLARETQHHALGVWRLDGATQRLQRLARCARRAVTQAHQHHAAGCDGWHLV